MSKKIQEKKHYEPPRIYEIEVDMRQAMGASQCQPGSNVQTCNVGGAANNNCNTGGQATTNCSNGPQATNGCNNGGQATIAG